MALSAKIWEHIVGAVDLTLEEIGNLGEAHAKRLAPVRKVFYTGRRAVKRDLSQAEIASLPSRIQALIIPNTARFGPGAGSPGARVQVVARRSGASQYAPLIRTEKGQKGVRFPASVRNVRKTESGFHLSDPDAEQHLTSRGRHELKSGRGVYTPLAPTANELAKGTYHKEPTLGGALRGQIGWSWISEGPIFIIAIESPEAGEGSSAAYSRFVELPNSHSAAQPYLRPTLQYLKRPLVQHLRRNLTMVGKFTR